MDINLPSNNPHKKLLQQFMSGVISQPDFQMALYIAVLKDDVAFRELRYRAVPPKPEALTRDELAFDRSILNLSGEDREKKRAEFFKVIRDKYRSYFDSIEKIPLMNRCNLSFLKEMFKFMDGRGEAYAFRIREIIYTYGREEAVLQTV